MLQPLKKQSVEERAVYLQDPAKLGDLDVELSIKMYDLFIDHAIIVYSHPGSFRLFVHVWVIMLTMRAQRIIFLRYDIRKYPTVFTPYIQNSDTGPTRYCMHS